MTIAVPCIMGMDESFGILHSSEGVESTINKLLSDQKIFSDITFKSRKGCLPTDSVNKVIIGTIVITKYGFQVFSHRLATPIMPDCIMNDTGLKSEPD